MYEEYTHYARELEAEYESIRGDYQAQLVSEAETIAALNDLIPRVEELKSRTGEPGLALLDNANNFLRRLVPEAVPALPAFLLNMPNIGEQPAALEQVAWAVHDAPFVLGFGAHGFFPPLANDGAMTPPMTPPASPVAANQAPVVTPEAPTTP